MIKTKRHYIILSFILVITLPPMSLAAKECRVIEFSDHFEAVCVGDPNYALKQREHAASNLTPTKGAEVSRKRQRISDIRSLNAHRFDAVEEQSIQNTAEKKK